MQEDERVKPIIYEQFKVKELKDKKVLRIDDTLAEAN